MRRATIGALLMAGGAVVAVLGTMLPWSILRAPWLVGGELRRSGLDGDGVPAALAALLCLLLALPARRWRPLSLVTLVLACAIVGGGVYFWRDIRGRMAVNGTDAIAPQVGDGIWFTIAGGLIVLVGAVVVLPPPVALTRKGADGGRAAGSRRGTTRRSLPRRR